MIKESSDQEQGNRKEINAPLSPTEEALLSAFSYFLEGKATVEKIKTHPLNRQQSRQLFYILVDNHGLTRAVELYQELANIQRGSASPEKNSALSIVKIERDKAKINASNFQDMKLVSIADRTLLESINKDLEAKDLLSLLIYSAMRYGGLLRKGAINGLIKKVLAREKIFTTAGQLWTTINLEDVSEPQIWLPDPITKIIWGKLSKKSSEFGLIEEWLNSFNRKPLVMTILNIQFDLRISQSRFTQAAANVIRLSCGSGLVESALSSSFDNRSMKSDVFIRMMTKKSPNLKDILDVEEAPKPRLSKQHTIEVAASGARDHFVLAKVRKLLKPLTLNSKKKLDAEQKTLLDDATSQIEDLLSKHSASLSPLLVLVVRWAVSRITIRNMWGNRHAPSSAIKRVSQIYNGLIDYLDQIDPIELDGDTLQDQYGQAIDDKETNSSRIDFTRSLRDFHSYLVEINPLLEIPSGALWHSSTDIKNDVDANLVWPWEYRKVIESINAEIKIAKESVSGGEWKEHLWKVRRFVMVMGYRCGMRRNEILYLRKSDLAIESRRKFLPRDQWEIIVRPHSKRALKSSSAYRRIPIGILATGRELNWIEELYRASSTVDIEDDSVWNHESVRYLCLHQSEEEGDWHISPGQVFDPITWLMAAVTGDKATRFHHLRHSFATINFWRWMHPAVTETSLFADRFEEEGIDAIKQRRIILGLRTGVEPSKKVLHALSMMIGHAEPKMTLCHYIHSANILLYERLRQALPLFEPRDMARLLEIGVRSPQDKRKGAGYINAILATEASIDQRLAKHRHRSSRNWPDTQRKRIAKYGRDVAAVTSTYMDIYTATYEIFSTVGPNGGDPHTIRSRVRELAMAYDISAGVLLTSCARAAHIAAMTHEMGGHKTRRHAPPKEQSKNIDAHSQLFLTYPRQKYSRALAQEFLARYQDLPEASKECIRPFLEFYIAKNKVANGWIECHSIDQFRAFQEFLTVLKIRPNIVSNTRLLHYRYTLRSKYFGRPKKLQPEKRYWKQLSLSSPIKLQVRTQEAYKAEYGILEVRPITIRSGSAKRCKSSDEFDRQVSRGLNFALYVLAIVDPKVKLAQLPKDFPI